MTLYQSKNAELVLISIFCERPVKRDPILDHLSMITRPFETMPFPAAHTRIANKWEYSPPPRKKYVVSWYTAKTIELIALRIYWWQNLCRHGVRTGSIKPKRQMGHVKFWSELNLLRIFQFENLASLFTFFDLDRTQTQQQEQLIYPLSVTMIVKSLVLLKPTSNPTA